MILDWDDIAERLYLIRATEKAIAERYKEGNMRTPTHLSIGQESAAVGVCMALPEHSQVFSNHRCHAHYLAQGGDLDGLIAELYGKATGCAGGWGGSMHLVDERVGFMGTSAIVGSSVSVAVGSSMAMKHDGNGQVVCAFMGDAAIETGQVYESLHLSGFWELPILFVMEDNGLATQTTIQQRQRNPDNWGSLVNLLGITSFDIGHTVEEVYETTKTALTQLPAFIRIKTQRWHTHVGPEFDWELGLTQHRSEGYLADYHETDEVAKALSLSSTSDAIICECDDRVNGAFTKAELAEWPK